MEDSKPEHKEPEWRQMWTAPYDKKILVKLTNISVSSLDDKCRLLNEEKGLTAKYEHGLWMVEDFYLMIDKSFVGWRPL